MHDDACALGQAAHAGPDARCLSGASAMPALLVICKLWLHASAVCGVFLRLLAAALNS